MQITTVIPAYNCAHYIRQAVASVLAQEIPSAVVVIDDASPDDIKGAIGDLIDSGQVLYLRNETNRGVAYSRNRGIDAADSEYIAFLDGDDFWQPGKLAAELELIERTQAPLVFSARALYDADGRSTGRVIHAPERVDLPKLLHTNCIPLGSVLMRTEIAREFRFARADLHEDYILWIRALEKYGEAYGIDEPYLACRLSEKGKSRNKLRSALMHYRTLRFVSAMGTPKLSEGRMLWLTLCYASAGLKKYFGKNRGEG